MKTYTKAVSATLAGALAVGMVPAMALADAPDAELDLLVLAPNDDFAAGKLTAATNNAGAAITDLKDIEFVANGKAQYMKPTKVKPAEGAEVDVTDVTKFEITYVKDLTKDTSGNITGGTPVDVADIIDPNDYAAKITGIAGDYNGAVFYAPFNIVSKSLKGLVAYEVKAVDTDLSDKTFTYSGSALAAGTAAGNIWFALNGTPLKAAEYSKVEAYRINPAGTAVAMGAGVMPTDAGKYVLKVTGAGEYAEATAEIALTIEAFDLANAEVYIASSSAFAEPTEWADLSNIGTVDHKTVLGKCDSFDGTDDGEGDKLKFVYKSDTTGNAIQGDYGEYTYTLSVNETAANEVPNFTGSKDLKFVVAETAATNLFYGTATAPSSIADVNYANGDKAVDLKGFSFMPTNAYKAADAIATKVVAYKKNADGSFTQVSDVAAPGSYKVEVSVDSAATNYKYYSAAPTVYEFDVTNGSVLESDLIVMYNGAAKTAITKTYDGKDALDLIQVKVKTTDGSKTLAAGTDYSYKITRTHEGVADTADVVVDEIVDAGTYVLSIEDGAYDMPATGNTVTITVSAIEIAGVRAANQVTIVTTDDDPSTTTDETVKSTGLAYTGKEIVPSFEYYAQAQIDAALAVAKVKENNAGLTWADNQADVLKYMEWVALPADIVATLDASTEPATVAEPKNGKVDQVGTYTMNLSVPAAVVNYTLASGLTSVSFNVINGSVFKDVPAGKWYTEAVMDAYTLGYMNGIGNGLFDPMGTVTRGMAACIAANMAGGSVNEDAGNINAGFNGIVTPFDDVDPYKWYAGGIRWAEKAGIVNGWTEGGKLVYAPDQEITREQWACMLGNYAKVYGAYEAPAADALAGFPDAGKVSSWAKESVAWAVENGIMGNGGSINPKAKISRAEAAAMAVNFQPEQLA